MTWLRLFSPSIVLGVWAGLWAAGARSDRLVGVMLALLAVTYAVAQTEARRVRDDR